MRLPVHAVVVVVLSCLGLQACDQDEGAQSAGPAPGVATAAAGPGNATVAEAAPRPSPVLPNLSRSPDRIQPEGNRCQTGAECFPGLTCRQYGRSPLARVCTSDAIDARTFGGDLCQQKKGLGVLHPQKFCGEGDRCCHVRGGGAPAGLRCVASSGVDPSGWACAD